MPSKYIWPWILLSCDLTLSSEALLEGDLEFINRPFLTSSTSSRRKPYLGLLK